MGGPGSGNWCQSGRNTVEGSRSIDVRQWKRDGYIPGPSWFRSYWTRDGEEIASIGVKVRERHQVVLNYRHRGYWDDDWSDVEQNIPLEWSFCHLGGERPWFVCSVYRNGIYCGNRVAKLYGAGKWFACRRCYNLSYQTQHEPPDGRALLKTQRIREKLGGSPSLADPFPDKPKGMHWKTYERLYRKAVEAEDASWLGLAERFDLTW